MLTRVRRPHDFMYFNLKIIYSLPLGIFAEAFSHQLNSDPVWEDLFLHFPDNKTQIIHVG